MPETVVSSTSPADPTIRSALYKLFSVAFRYPSPEVFVAFQDGSFLHELFEKIASLPHLSGLTDGADELIAKVQSELDEWEFRDFEVAFVRTFDVGAPAPPCPPYEGLNRGGERTRIMLQVSEFYRHFGLAMSQEEAKRELPDHLCSELEFMHFLAFKEAQASREESPELLQGYRLAQKDFLERHLSKWVPAFCEKVQQAVGLSFYPEVAQIAKEVIAEECGWLSAHCVTPSAAGT